jgi:AcrR family transcriptional regulator
VSPTRKAAAKDWIAAVLAVLDEDRSPAETSIEELGAKIGAGVTKGAFYPHFANVAALREAAVAEWLRGALAAMPNTAVSADGAVRDPLDRIRKIAEALAGRGIRDGAMRRWAASDAVAANAVALADRIVISHLEHALIDLGFPGKEAAAQASFIAAALQSRNVAADQEILDLVLDGLARSAAFAGQGTVIETSEAAGAVVLSARRGTLTADHLRLLQQTADMLAAPRDEADLPGAGPGTPAGAGQANTADHAASV